MRDALQRFATGTYAVWYPQLQRRESESLPGQLRRLAAGDWLDVALTRQRRRPPTASVFTAAACSSSIRRGSSRRASREAMPMLVEALGQDAARGVQARIPADLTSICAQTARGRIRETIRAMDNETRWKYHGVRVVRAGELDTNTPQTPGMNRAAAITHARAGAEKLWAGTVVIHPKAKTGAHHHGPVESVIYVVSGRARMRWGDKLEFMAEAGPGDFIYVPPYVPHQEINANDDDPLSCVLVRSGQEPVVVNLDIPMVEKPEEVHWVDNIHPAPEGVDSPAMLDSPRDKHGGGSMRAGGVAGASPRGGRANQSNGISSRKMTADA